MSQRPNMEGAVLGSVLADGGLWAQVEALTPGDFEDARHSLVFTAMRQVAESNRPLDHLTVAEALKAAGNLARVGGPGFLMRLDSLPAFSSHVAEYVAAVRKRAMRRHTATAYRDALAALEDESKPLPELVTAATQRLAALAEAADVDADRMGDEDVDAVNDDWHRFYSGEPGPFLPLGVDVIDGLFKGFHHNVNLVGGKASIGKTAFIAELIWGWLKQGIPGGIFGLEDGTRWLWERHCSRAVGIPYGDVAACMLHDYQMGSYEDAYKKAKHMLGTLLRTHCVSGLEGPALLATARRWIRRGARWLVIDHGGRIEHEMAHERENHALGIKRTIQALDDMAHNEGVPIIINWHFNRAGATAGVPTMEAFRETGYLEMFAGSMLGLWERPQDEGHLLVTCVKNRKGKRDWTVAVQRDAEHGLVHRAGGYVVDLKAEAEAARAEEEAARGARSSRRGGGYP